MSELLSVTEKRYIGIPLLIMSNTRRYHFWFFFIFHFTLELYMLHYNTTQRKGIIIWPFVERTNNVSMNLSYLCLCMRLASAHIHIFRSSIPYMCLDINLAAEHTRGSLWIFHRLSLSFCVVCSCLLPLPPFLWPMSHCFSLWPTSLRRSLEPIRDAIKASVTGCLRCVQVCKKKKKKAPRFTKIRQLHLRFTPYSVFRCWCCCFGS